MKLSPYGRREWGAISAVAIVLGGAGAWLQWWWALGAVAVIWLALVAFFRDPARRVPSDLPAGTMLSPADGTISKVVSIDHHEATGGPARVVRIFLSIFNVHINRAPFDGDVVALKHVPGKYHDARTEISAEENESNLVVMRIAGDETIGVRQVSGAVARRIVCPLTIGDRLRRGERYGMIKFGSTTELILPRPDDVEVLVRDGDKVKAGLTPLARLVPRGTTDASKE